jgi:general L-amino acid transport system substrate-binding protein
MRILGAAVAFVGLALATQPAAAQATFEAVKKRGALLCGSHQGNPGFSYPDKDGVWRGLDVEICRAVAAATLGDAQAVRFVPLSPQQRIVAVQTGEVDIMSRTTTWTLRRDAGSGVNFTVPVFFDYTAFMVPKALGVSSPKQLDGASICVTSGTIAETFVADYAKKTGIRLKPILFDRNDAARAAYFAGRCDTLSTDASSLAAVRASTAQNPDDHIIIPATSRLEALAPAVRHGDDQWLDIVRWTIFALFAAEDLGITQANVDELARTSQDPDIRRFLGVDPGNGKALGLDERWAYNIVKQVGNYAEIYDRNVGPRTPLKLERGVNRLAKNGGLMTPLTFN